MSNANAPRSGELAQAASPSPDANAPRSGELAQAWAVFLIAPITLL